MNDAIKYFWVGLIISCLPVSKTMAFEGQKQSTLNIEYMEIEPLVDGVLDSQLASLKKHEFPIFHDLDNPINDKHHVTYRLAFNETHLYVFIETNAKEISYNKRGYLYGDGYKIMLGKYNQNNASDEYYDLYYSPSLQSDGSNNQLIGTHNFKHINQRFSEHSQSQESENQNSTGFEALVAWEDIQPFNPFFMDDLGINIYFAKYVEKEMTHGYSFTKDESIWDEEIPTRSLYPVNFSIPTTPLITTQIHKKNYQVGEPLRLKVFNRNIDTTLVVKLASKQGKVLLQNNASFEHTNGLIETDLEFNPKGLKPGNYTLTVEQNHKKSNTETISVLPEFNTFSLLKKIKSASNSLPSAKSTLGFKATQLGNKLSQLKSYESGESILQTWEKIKKELAVLNTNKDPYANINKPHRKAFLSKIDNTYQPYTIKLPDNYDKKQQYPLLVFLHGSAQDEQHLLNKPRSDGRFIELAPLGRDLYRAYSFTNSQLDIKEAIEDVIRHYPVDTNRIIVGGFSMGGYGALRTFYEYPELFKGVAIFSGHPDLANAWGVEGIHPNFLMSQFSEKLNTVPVFIYHGEKDEAIKFNLVKQLKETLIKSGVHVTSSFVPNRGHVYQDDDTNILYHKWLKQF